MVGTDRRAKKTRCYSGIHQWLVDSCTHHYEKEIPKQADLFLLDHPSGSVTQLSLLSCIGLLGKVRQDGGTATNETLEEDQWESLAQTPKTAVARTSDI